MEKSKKGEKKNQKGMCKSECTYGHSRVNFNCEYDMGPYVKTGPPNPRTGSRIPPNVHPLRDLGRPITGRVHHFFRWIFQHFFSIITDSFYTKKEVFRNWEMFANAIHALNSKLLVNFQICSQIKNSCIQKSSAGFKTYSQCTFFTNNRMLT